MEIRSLLKDQLIIEAKPMIRQLLYLALALAGMSLWIGSVKEYGIGAWYRFFYMGGIIIFIAGIAGLLFYNVTTRFIIDMNKKVLSIEKESVISTNETENIPLSDIDRFKLKSLMKKDREVYEVIMVGKDGSETILSPSLLRDFGSAEQMVKMMNRFLGADINLQ